MNANTLRACLAALALTFLGPAAWANVLSLTPLATVAPPGSKVVLEIRMDFVQETVGGAFDLHYDGDLLQFQDFHYDPRFLLDHVDPDFLLVPDNCVAGGSGTGGCDPGDYELNALGFGNFDGIIGSYVVARITFTTLQPGTAEVQLAATDSPFGGFSDIMGEELTVIYNGAKVLITPIPAAIWMMLGALGVLTRLRR